MNSIKTFNEKTKILFVGHLTKGKNIESLLPVLKKISIKYPLEFILVGDGPERRNLKDLSEKLGISKIVKFEGFKQQSELSKYYLDADIFVFPSNYDIWGLVVIEAMVHSLVCITSIHSGVSDDLIENGQTGYAIDFSNKEEVEKIS